MELTLDSLFSLFTVFVSWILVLFLITAKTKNKLSNIILIAFLLVNAQDASGLFSRYFLYPKYPGLGMLLNSTVFMKLPLLYLYFLSVVYSDFKLSKKHLWHLIPFVLDILIFIPNYYSQDYDAKYALLRSPTYDRTFEFLVSYSMIHAQIAVYGILCFLLIKKYKKLLLENFSNANLFNYRWLFQLISLFMLTALIATFKNIIKISHLDNLYKYAQFITQLFSLGIMAWIVIKALHNPELFKGIKSDLQLVKNIVPIVNSNNNEQEDKEIDALKRFMIEHEPFLNPSLSIEELANQSNIPAKKLSVLINHHLNQHFFDFVNSYRIEKAADILKDNEKKDLTVLEILYEVGFNSKSSFNTAFKKYTGKTPTEYRKTYL